MESAEVGETSVSLIDQHVGSRLRTLRRARWVTQAEIAEALGVTFQQVQKYEDGSNRISASKLFAAAQRLGVNVSDFFSGLTWAEPVTARDGDVASDPRYVSGVKALRSLQRHRRKLALELIEALAAKS